MGVSTQSTWELVSCLEHFRTYFSLQLFKMADKYSLRAWKRPVSRSYEFNLQVGENYYKHLTNYLDTKTSTLTKVDLPGALTYSERLAHNPISGRTSVKLVTDSKSYFSHTERRTFVAN